MESRNVHRRMRNISHYLFVYIYKKKNRLSIFEIVFSDHLSLSRLSSIKRVIFGFHNSPPYNRNENRNRVQSSSPRRRYHRINKYFRRLAASRTPVGGQKKKKKNRRKNDPRESYSPSAVTLSPNNRAARRVS